MAQAVSTSALAHNAISSITVQCAAGSTTLRRSLGVQKNPPEIVPNYSKSWPSRPWPLPRPRSDQTRPPPGELHLHLHLPATLLGRGRSGRIFEVKIDPQNSSPEVSSFHVPLLVAKVSRAGKHEDLSHEAHCYDVLSPLQGVVVPRCYGYFEGSGSVTAAGDADDDAEVSGTPMLSLLLLEKLGDVLPLYQEPPSGALEEISAMYADISELGINHIDIRWQNILYALPSPPGLPGLPSPYQDGHPVYRWRIVDFADSVETNINLRALVSGHCSYVSEILAGLVYGYPPEPDY